MNFFPVIMKLRLIALAAALAAPFAQAANGPLKEKANALSTSNKDSVLFLSAVVELEINAGDNPAKKEERKVEMLGTVISKDGLIVVPLSSLDVSSAVDGRTVNTPQGPLKLSAKSNTKEVKILMPDGSETPAKVAFKDVDLDLAFVRPEKKEGVTFTPVDTANGAKFSLLDDVIVLGRLGKDLNREPVVMTSEVISVVSKPRIFGRIGAPSLGMPVFNGEGKFLGVGVNRFSPKGDADGQAAPVNVLLPVADLLESASQAK